MNVFRNDSRFTLRFYTAGRLNAQEDIRALEDAIWELKEMHETLTAKLPPEPSARVSLKDDGPGYYADV